MTNGVVDGINLATSYNHMSGYSAYVGQHVNRGDVIGYVGETGYATGCHLHFMVYENGATVDPMTWL
jgi:murein DD-endopeptidase MepM/ murein hydrolase activator NlpD